MKNLEQKKSVRHKLAYTDFLTFTIQIIYLILILNYVHNFYGYDQNKNTSIITIIMEINCNNLFLQ